MNMPSKISYTVICFCLILAACDPGSQRRLDRETMEREMRHREPRRIKEAEIIDAALVQGQEIARLLRATAVVDTSSAAACCPTLPQPTLDSLNNHYQAQVACFVLLAPNPAADTLEQQLLDAYRYSLEQRQPLQDNIQAQGHEHIVYTTPITNGGNTKQACAIWRIRLNRKQVVLSMQ